MENRGKLQRNCMTTMNKKYRQSKEVKERMITNSHQKTMDTFVYNEQKITTIERTNGYFLTSQNDGYVRLQ